MNYCQQSSSPSLIFSFNEELSEDGDYRICLDNTQSRWSDKTVWFEVQLEDPNDDYDDDYMEDEDWEKIKAVDDDTEKLFDMKMEEIQVMLLLHLIPKKLLKKPCLKTENIWDNDMYLYHVLIILVPPK